MTDKLSAAVGLGLINEGAADVVRDWCKTDGISVLEAAEKILQISAPNPKMEALVAFLKVTEKPEVQQAAVDAGAGLSGADLNAALEFGFQVLGGIFEAVIQGVGVAAEGVAEVCKAATDL